MAGATGGDYLPGGGATHASRRAGPWGVRRSATSWFSTSTRCSASASCRWT